MAFPWRQYRGGEFSALTYLTYANTQFPAFCRLRDYTASVVATAGHIPESLYAMRELRARFHSLSRRREAEDKEDTIPKCQHTYSVCALVPTYARCVMCGAGLIELYQNNAHGWLLSARTRSRFCSAEVDLVLIVLPKTKKVRKVTEACQNELCRKSASTSQPASQPHCDTMGLSWEPDAQFVYAPPDVHRPARLCPEHCLQSLKHASQL